MAQLIQELLLCCCQGGGEKGSGKLSKSTTAGISTKQGGGASWGGLETARLAARCLDALCHFAPGASTWRRFLPGTFSGLFRAVRGMEMDAAADPGDGAIIGAVQASMPPLASISQVASTTAVTSGGQRLRGGVRGSGGAGGGGASKSVVAETCLAVLTKVLLMCAGEAPDIAVGGNSLTRSTPPVRAVVGAGTGASNKGGADFGGDSHANHVSENPLLVLQKLAMTSNARAAEKVSGTPERAPVLAGHRKPGSDGGLPSTPTAVAVDVENSEWEAQASGRLRVLIPPLLTLCRLHPGWRVRRASAAFASALLIGSGGRVGGGGRGNKVDGVYSGAKLGGEGSAPEGGLLGPLIPSLMEALVGLAMDDMPQVTVVI